MLRQAVCAFTFLFAASALAALPDDQLIDEGSRKLEAGDARAAIDDFQHAQEKAPKDPRPHYLRGVAFQKLNDPAAAEEAFRKALALDPKLAEVRNELAALLTERKRYADAVKELKVALAQKPDLPEAWYNLGQALLAEKQCPDAIDAYRHVTRLQPNEADGWINLSVAQRKCKTLPEAQASA